MKYVCEVYFNHFLFVRQVCTYRVELAMHLSGSFRSNFGFFLLHVLIFTVHLNHLVVQYKKSTYILYASLE